MSDGAREAAVKGVLALLQAASPGGPFNRFGRGNPVGQTVPATDRPAVFLVELGERPISKGFQEIESHRLFIGLILLGTQRGQGDFEAMPQELNELSDYVHQTIEDQKPASGCGPLRKVGRDEPEANQSLPAGSTMPMYRLDYSHVRASP